MNKLLLGLLALLALVGCDPNPQVHYSSNPTENQIRLECNQRLVTATINRRVPSYLTRAMTPGETPQVYYLHGGEDPYQRFRVVESHCPGSPR